MPVQLGIAWDPNPVEEGVTSYQVLLDGQPYGSPTAETQATVEIPEPTRHEISFFPIGPYGPGPTSDPIFSFPPTTQGKGLRFTSIQIVNTITTVVNA